MATRAQHPSREAVGGPAVDIAREGDTLVLTVALPGLRPSDFRISLVGSRQVHIEGTVPYRCPVPREHLATAERVYGPFSRTVPLPLPVDAQGAALSLQNGLLTARLPIIQNRLPLAWEPAGGGSGAEPG